MFESSHPDLNGKTRLMNGGFFSFGQTFLSIQEKNSAMHYTYIIESIKTGRWYYGYTSDLSRRLEGHNKGLNVSTRNRGPWKFIFIREFESKTEAIAFEQVLKRYRNKEFIKNNFTSYFIANLV